MDQCHLCEKEAEFGCHGIVNHEIVSFDACAEHKGWETTIFLDNYPLTQTDAS